MQLIFSGESIVHYVEYTSLFFINCRSSDVYECKYMLSDVGLEQNTIFIIQQPELQSIGHLLV